MSSEGEIELEGDLAEFEDYVFRYREELVRPEERLALDLVVDNSSPPPLQRLILSRRYSAAQRIIEETAKQGLNEDPHGARKHHNLRIRAAVARRVLEEHGDIRTRCPSTDCNALLRTRLARMCPSCGHSWHS